MKNGINDNYSDYDDYDDYDEWNQDEYILPFSYMMITYFKNNDKIDLYAWDIYID